MAQEEKKNDMTLPPDEFCSLIAKWTGIGNLDVKVGAEATENEPDERETMRELLIKNEDDFFVLARGGDKEDLKKLGVVCGLPGVKPTVVAQRLIEEYGAKEQSAVAVAMSSATQQAVLKTCGVLEFLATVMDLSKPYDFPRHHRLPTNYTILKNSWTEGKTVEDETDSLLPANARQGSDDNEEVEVYDDEDSSVENDPISGTQPFTLKKLYNDNGFVAVTCGHALQLFDTAVRRDKTPEISVIKMMRGVKLYAPDGREFPDESVANEAQKVDLEFKVFVPIAAGQAECWTTDWDVAVIVSKRGQSKKEIVSKLSSVEILKNTSKLFKVSSGYMDDPFNGGYSLRDSRLVIEENIARFLLDSRFPDPGMFIYTNGKGGDGTSGSAGFDYMGNLACLWSGPADVVGRYNLLTEAELNKEFMLYQDFVSLRAKRLDLKVTDRVPPAKLLLQTTQDAMDRARQLGIKVVEQVVRPPPPPPPPPPNDAQSDGRSAMSTFSINPVKEKLKARVSEACQV